MTTNFDHLPYRPCVGLMILNNSNQVFAARRIDMVSEAWQMPQGGIDDGEEPQQAALREMLEEIGTNNVEIVAESADWLNYDLPDHLIPRLWKGQYRGQKQRWFLCRFLGQDSEINIQTEKPEFSQWQWLDPKKLPDLAVTFKREIYQKLLKEFHPHL